MRKRLVGLWFSVKTLVGKVAGRCCPCMEDQRPPEPFNKFETEKELCKFFSRIEDLENDSDYIRRNLHTV